MIQIEIDMEMPESCPKCKFYKDQNDAEYCIITGHRFTLEDIFAATDSLENAKPFWCPLREAQDATMLQGFLADIPSSESILNSVNCHAISLEDASHIIAICSYACDVMSPSGFIHWLKERFNQDFVLKGCVSG